ncbi:MAG: amidohydrolase 2 [Osedax symbiont Rs1]|nr:MAG: amidohydrolase 2 [Osedax symbiont Rs1]
MKQPTPLRKITGTAPNTTLPKGSIDSHMHIYARDYPTQAGGPQSPSDFAGLDKYRQVQAWLGLERLVIVQANAHQQDNSCLLNALNHFGDSSRGVACIRPNTPESTLEEYHRQGVRAARIMELGGATRLHDLLAVNSLVQPFNWSCIVQFDGNQINQHSALLQKIQGNYVLDHHAKFMRPISVDSSEFSTLLKLIDRGNCYFKLAGCYETSRSGYPDYADLAKVAKALIAHAPQRIIWGSNWPHVSKPATDTPDDGQLLDTVCSWIPSRQVLRQIFVDNPAKLYDFSQ